jgi:SNF2 family DNA or RNA helicase
MEIKKRELNYGLISKKAKISFMSSLRRITLDPTCINKRYKLATGAKEDRMFLKGFNFDVCIFDEGHMLKNSMSKQYIQLMKLSANFRVLLTGTVLTLQFPRLQSSLFKTIWRNSSHYCHSYYPLSSPKTATH